MYNYLIKLLNSSDKNWKITLYQFFWINIVIILILIFFDMLTGFEYMNRIYSIFFEQETTTLIEQYDFRQQPLPYDIIPAKEEEGMSTKSFIIGCVVIVVVGVIIAIIKSSAS